MGAVLVPAGSAAAFTLNAIELDNGTCVQNLQLGSDHTASPSNTPSFLLTGDGPLSSYQFSIGGNVIGTFSANVYGNVCIDDTTPLAEGSHVLTGQELTPHPSNVISPFDFTVETVPLASPSEPTLDPVTDSSVQGDDITNFSSIRVDGTSVASVPIRIMESGRLVGGAMANSAGYWTAMTDPLSAGLNLLSAATVSESGVPSVDSAALAVTIISSPPPAPPAPTLDPASGSGGIATVSDPTIDGAGASAQDTVTVSLDGAEIGSTVSDISGNWRFTLPILSSGSHSVTATVTDVAGNVSATSVPLALTISSPTAPGSPTLTATAASGSVMLSWSAPPDGGSPVTSYDVYRGTSPGTETLLGSAESTSEIDTAVTDGTAYYYEVTAINSVGPSQLSNEVTATPAVAEEPPVIMSAPKATVRMRHVFRFVVTASGFPSPTFSESGRLPLGVSFNTSTGAFSGMSETGSKGSYKVIISAANPVGTANQTLTLRVTRP